jgi:hypothetical protein
MLAFVRPDDFNLPLLLHVAGAMILVGALVAAGVALLQAARLGPGEGAGLSRFGFRTLLYAAIPAFILMRVGAQWVASEEGLDDSDAAWIGLGYISTDAGVLILIAATVTAGLTARRFASGDTRSGLSRVAPVLTLLMVAVYLVVVWAMATKPS